MNDVLMALDKIASGCDMAQWLSLIAMVKASSADDATKTEIITFAQAEIGATATRKASINALIAKYGVDANIEPQAPEPPMPPEDDGDDEEY
jgi:hypothetical protein